MKKVNAIILFLFSLLVGLGQSGNIAAAIMSGNIKLPKLAFYCIVLILCIVGVVKSIMDFTRSSNVIIEPPTTQGKKVIYNFGNVLLIISGIVALCTVGLMLFLYVNSSAGIPAGMGLAAALVLYVMGQALKGVSQKTHNN